jgi:hypothetical protein
MIQNELISICGKLICKQILDEVNNSEYFSLLADETADISGVEQLSIGVRFVDNELKVREEFLGFTPLEKCKAEDIAGAILSTTREVFNLDMNKLVGLGFDGCSTMAGKENGVQKIIINQYPKAKFFHCASHRLNLVVNDLNSVPEFRNTVGIVKEVIRFFRESPLRRRLVTNIPLLCETRWSSKYKSIRIFFENLTCIKSVLETLSSDPEVTQATRTAACQLSAVTGTSKFLICLVIMAKYSSYFEPVANILQSKTINLEEVHCHVDKLLIMLKNSRDEKNVEYVFKEILTSAKKIAEIFCIELSMPRIVSKQIQRSNFSTSSVEDYFRISLFIPYLDSLISSLGIRFSEENRIPTFLCILHPSRIKYLTISEYLKKIEPLQSMYNIDNFRGEAESWFSLWKNSNDVEVDENVCYSELILKHCTFFPAVSQAIKILLTLPPTTCTIERSFSTLRRVKTWLRSTISQDRLNGLCLLSVHREKVFDKKKQLIDDVVTEFGKERRRIKFLFSKEH